MTFVHRGAGIVGALAILGLVECMPNPQSVKERRVNYDRSALKGRLILDKPPADMQRVDAVFGGAVKLLGYTLSPAQPGRGSRLTVTYYWSALKPMAEDYKVFIHGDAIGVQDRVPRIHGDHYPALEKYPTDVWQVGEVVVDRFAVDIPPGYGAPELGLYSGLYKGDYRVPLSDSGRSAGGRDNRSLAVRLRLN